MNRKVTDSCDEHIRLIYSIDGVEVVHATYIKSKASDL